MYLMGSSANYTCVKTLFYFGEYTFRYLSKPAAITTSASIRYVTWAISRFDHFIDYNSSSDSSSLT